MNNIYPWLDDQLCTICYIRQTMMIWSEYSIILGSFTEIWSLCLLYDFKIYILSPALLWLFGLIVLEWWFREEQGANISNCNNNSCPGPISIIRPIQETNEKQRNRDWVSETIIQWEARIMFNGPIRKQEMPVKNKGSNTGASRTRYKKWYKDIY